MWWELEAGGQAAVAGQQEVIHPQPRGWMLACDKLPSCECGILRHMYSGVQPSQKSAAEHESALPGLTVKEQYQEI